MADHPFLERIAKRGKSGHGKASEKRLAKSLASRLTPASGALTSAKGDMRLKSKTVGKVMVEAKSTVHSTLSLDLGWLVKVATEALAVGATPSLTISFVTPEGKSRPHGDWVAVPAHIYRELVDPEEP